MKIKINESKTQLTSEKDKELMEMLKEEHSLMDEKDWDKPLIVGKHDWNKPVILDTDPNNPDENKDPVEEWVKKQMKYLREVMGMDDALAKHYYYRIKWEEMALEEKWKIDEE